MTHVGLSLNNQDLHLDANGDLAMVYNAEAVGQHGRQRLKTFKGEWFLDEDAGVPWLSDILGKSNNPALAESVVKSQLLKTDGIEDIESFSSSFDRATRGLSAFSIRVKTIYDDEVDI